MIQCLQSSTNIFEKKKFPQDLLLYLLQLVQALKYENFDEINAGYMRVVSSSGSQEEKESSAGVCECSTRFVIDCNHLTVAVTI